MGFDYLINSGKDSEKWIAFNQFLDQLEAENEKEFSKDMYKTRRFMGVGYGSNPPDIICTFNPKVPSDIQKKIKDKLYDLFPKRN